MLLIIAFSYQAWIIIENFKIYVVVNFLCQLIFTFPSFLGMIMYANEFETKEK